MIADFFGFVKFCFYWSIFVCCFVFAENRNRPLQVLNQSFWSLPTRQWAISPPHPTPPPTLRDRTLFLYIIVSDGLIVRVFYIFQDDVRSDICSCHSVESLESESGTEMKKNINWFKVICNFVRWMLDFFFTTEENSLSVWDNFEIFHINVCYL